MKHLSDLKVGEKCKVTRVIAEAAIKRKLLEMGIVPGVEVQIQKVAPLGDPVDVLVKGYHLSLRREEADAIGELRSCRALRDCSPTDYGFLIPICPDARLICRRGI